MSNKGGGGNSVCKTFLDRLGQPSLAFVGLLKGGTFHIYQVKVKQSNYRPGVTQRVPGS
jgi:hypothetical protein